MKAATLEAGSNDARLFSHRPAPIA